MVIALAMACRILDNRYFGYISDFNKLKLHITTILNLIRTLIRMKVLPGSKNSRKPERKQQAPPPEMPMMKANLTPIEPRWLPTKGVTIKATRQLVPMIRP